MATKKEEPKKTYILELTNGNTRKITIPSNWKMTFGSTVPHVPRSHGGYNGSEGGVALRLYEGTKENLRAVMRDVMSIRDADIEIIEKRTSIKRQTVQKETPQGMKDVMVEARMTEWVNPDKDDESVIPDEFLRLPETPKRPGAPTPATKEEEIEF